MRTRLILIALLACLVAAYMPAAYGASAVPAQPPVFSFAVFGDNRPERPDKTQPQAFREVLRSIAAHSPDFAVNTGDCIYGSSSMDRVRTQYKDYTDTVTSLLKPKVYLAVGNHEIAGSKVNQAYFGDQLDGTFYSFDYGDSHFIVLSSEVVGETGRVTGEQLDWLTDDLHSARAARHKFVLLHRPLYPVDGHRGSSMDKYSQDRDALHSLFVRNRITAVFAGHEHLFNAQKRNGVRYIITGGGGAFTYPSAEGEGDYHHFVLVSVNGDKVEMKVIRPASGGKPKSVEPVKTE